MNLIYFAGLQATKEATQKSKLQWTWLNYYECMIFSRSCLTTVNGRKLHYLWQNLTLLSNFHACHIKIHTGWIMFCSLQLLVWGLRLWRAELAPVWELCWYWLGLSALKIALFANGSSREKLYTWLSSSLLYGCKTYLLYSLFTQSRLKAMKCHKMWSISCLCLWWKCCPY